jgi:hypothetical protein
MTTTKTAAEPFKSAAVFNDTHALGEFPEKASGQPRAHLLKIAKPAGNGGKARVAQG